MQGSAIMVTILLLIWIVALIPIALRSHSQYRLVTSVARFRRHRLLLERAYAHQINAHASESRKLVGTFDGSPPPTPRRSLNSRIATRRRRRLTTLGALGTSFLLTLGVGFAPDLRALWVVAIVLAVLLGTYLALLARCIAQEERMTNREMHERVGSLHIETRPSTEREPDVAAPDSIGVEPIALRPRVRLDLEEQSA